MENAKNDLTVILMFIVLVLGWLLFLVPTFILGLGLNMVALILGIICLTKKKIVIGIAGILLAIASSPFVLGIIVFVL